MYTACSSCYKLYPTNSHISPYLPHIPYSSWLIHRHQYLLDQLYRSSLYQQKVMLSNYMSQHCYLP